MVEERPGAEGKCPRFSELGRGHGHSLRRLRCPPQWRHGKRGDDARHGGIRRREHPALVAAVWNSSLPSRTAPVHMRGQRGQ